MEGKREREKGERQRDLVQPFLGGRYRIVMDEMALKKTVMKIGKKKKSHSLEDEFLKSERGSRLREEGQTRVRLNSSL